MSEIVPVVWAHTEIHGSEHSLIGVPGARFTKNPKLNLEAKLRKKSDLGNS